MKVGAQWPYLVASTRQTNANFTAALLPALLLDLSRSIDERNSSFELDEVGDNKKKKKVYHWDLYIDCILYVSVFMLGNMEIILKVKIQKKKRTKIR